MSRRVFPTLLITTALLIIISHSAQAVDSYATPVGESVVGGNVSFDRSAEGRLNVTQYSDRAAINWDSFNIGKKATTEFFQPSSSSLAVNRVVSDTSDPTQILGSLKANGQIMVLDRNGVFFGKNSVVDVGGIIASTGNIQDSAIMNGDTEFTFDDMGSGAIDVQGKISVAEAGLAALVAPTVKNSGAITATLGRVELAAGAKATVDLYGDSLVEIAVDGELEQAMIQNTGKIIAEGGVVAMSASAAQRLVDGLINTKGIIDVSSVSVDGGKIILAGNQDINIDGKLYANGNGKGGNINISGENIDVGAKGRITADSSTGTGGDIGLSAHGVNISGRLNSSGATGGGDIEIAHRGANIDKNARLVSEARNSGKGGDISLNGVFEDSSDFAGRILSSGKDGGGNITLSDSHVRTTADSRIVTEATSAGAGGDIFIGGATDALHLHGLVSSKGPDRGGNILMAGGVNDFMLVNVEETASILSEGTGANGIGGAIELSGAAIDGIISANGKAGGGKINVNSFTWIRPTGEITADATRTGIGGEINLANGEGQTRIEGLVSASGRQGGGIVNIMSADGSSRVTETGTILAQAYKSGIGGKINMDGADIEGLIDVSGRNGGGDISLGDEAIEEAAQVSGLLKADAKKTGNGGNVRLFAGGGDQVQFSGEISARGGSGSGDGGTVFFSTPNTIEPGSTVDVSAPKGNAGQFIH